VSKMGCRPNILEDAECLPRSNSGLIDFSLVRQLPIGVNLSDVAAIGAHAPPGTKGRCIPRLQIYRMSAQIPRPRDWYGVR
jgi:hypothetical protein